MEMREGEINMREGELGGNIVIPYAVEDVAKEISIKAPKNMTQTDPDALKMISNTTELAEAPMPTETREGALKKREGVLKTAE